MSINNVKVGDIVHADIFAGEIVGGQAAGLDPRVSLIGIGLTKLTDIYSPWELTEFARPEDRTWAARVLSVPEED